jgi:endoglucanase
MKIGSIFPRTPRESSETGRRRLLGTRNKAIAALVAAIAVVVLLVRVVGGSSPSSTASLADDAAAATNGAIQLHVSGNQLVNASGQRVVLHGADHSGTEFMCVQKRGIFDGPTTEASIRTMKADGINAVRVPLNEDCWNGASYVKPAWQGAAYRSAIEAYVNRLNANGIVAIVDLHWTDGQYMGPASACSSAQATCQKPMPDAAGAIPFWRSVAKTFNGNDAVIFDLFNEPYPEQADHMNMTEGWQCWLHGGNCAGIGYKVAGMQDMVNAVRSTGATNVLMLGGLEWSNDLSQWLKYEPVDPDHNLAASWHSYNFNACSTKECWTQQIAPVIKKVPLIAGEIGENDCAGTYINKLTNWMNSEGASYLAWTWNPDFNCFSGPGLITSYNGAPTKFGAAYEATLRADMQHEAAVTAKQSAG